MTALAATSRGRLIGDEAAAAPLEAPTVRGGVIAALACALPMFAQCFQYVVDTPPLYLLSKLWPFLTLPLALLGAMRLATPYKPLILMVLAWTLGVAPAISIVELGNTFVGAGATTLKVWSLTFAFSLPVALVLLRPTEEELRRTLIGLGIATFAIMTLLYLFAPESAYDQGLLETKLFLKDAERGKRIYAPMFFGMMLVFLLNRSFWLRPKLWKAAGLVACFLLLVLVYKQRTAIAAAGVVILLGMILSLPRGRFTLTALLVAVGVWPTLILIQSIATDLHAGFGASLSIRQLELAAAVNFLNDEPIRWLFGVGSINRVGATTLADIVQTDVLYLADLGWLGVIFEYGAIGALLLLLTHLAVIHVCLKGAAHRDPLARALLDYSVFILLSSAVYSVVFAPGELMACLGLAWWLQRRASERAEAAAPGQVLWSLARGPAGAPAARLGATPRGAVLGFMPAAVR
jgi:hypothetical protein